MHMSISPWSGDKGLQRLPFMKFYNVLEEKCKFTIGLNTVKNIDHIKKSFRQK